MKHQNVEDRLTHALDIAEKEYLQSRAIIGEISVDDYRSFEGLPYPYIFKPPSPPGDLGLSGQAKLKTEYIIEKKEQKTISYCKHCGADLPKGQAICHVCGKKVI